MNITIDNILFTGSILLFLSVLGGKTSYKYGFPTLIFFLLIGMLAGSEGIGRIHFDKPEIAQFIGIVALNFILFSGGLDTTWKTIKPVVWHGASLSTVGVIVTAGCVGGFVYYVTDFSLFEALLLGAIVSSTDAAAVFSILRAKSIALKSNLRATLELESGSNDPMAYLLTITFTVLVMNPEAGWASMIPFFIKQITLGALLGYVFGRIGKYLINHMTLYFEGLYPVLVITLMFFTYSLTDMIGGNGFLAVYLSAVYLGNQELIHKRTIMQMFDGLGWLMQIILFITLGLLVYPSEILPIVGLGIIVSAFLIFVARPISVMVALLPFRMTIRKKAYISWVGLRGAVPIVFATFPLLAGVEKAGMIFNLVFFISLSSVLLQGTTLTLVAKWLHVALPRKAKLRTPKDLILEESMKSEIVEIQLSPNCASAGKRIVELDFPRNAIIAMISRNGNYITPNGNTVLEASDKLVILAENKRSLEEVFACLHIEQTSYEDAQL